MELPGRFHEVFGRVLWPRRPPGARVAPGPSWQWLGVLLPATLTPSQHAGVGANDRSPGSVNGERTDQPTLTTEVEEPGDGTSSPWARRLSRCDGIASRMRCSASERLLPATPHPGGLGQRLPRRRLLVRSPPRSSWFRPPKSVPSLDISQRTHGRILAVTTRDGHGADTRYPVASRPMGVYPVETWNASNASEGTPRVPSESRTRGSLCSYIA
jgi:hypothetical protein